MANGLLSTILDTTGDRLKERLKQSHDLDKTMRETQTQALIQSIYAVDENGNLKLSPQQAEEAWARIEQLHKHNKGIKDILLKARDITQKIFGMAGKANPAMAGRAAEQTLDALSGGQGGTLVQGQQGQQAQPMSEVTPIGGSSTQIPQIPYTPPPPGQAKQPVQQVASAASQVTPGALPPPPTRMSTVELMRAGAPSPVREKIAEEGRAEQRAIGSEGRAAERAEEQARLQSQLRVEEQYQTLPYDIERIKAQVRAQRESATDKEIHTDVNETTGTMTVLMQRPDNTTYTIQTNVPVDKKSRYQRVEIADPKNPRIPMWAGYDPGTNKFYHLGTEQEVPNARPYIKPTDSMEDMRKFQRGNFLRDDYNRETQALRDREDIYEFIDTMRDAPQGGPTDIVLLYNFVKLNDPNAAREGELQLVQQGASIPDTWRRYVNQFLEGDVLAPQQRKRMIEAADKLYEGGVRARLQAINDRYTATAQRNEVDPRDVIRPTRPGKGDTRVIDGKTYYKVPGGWSTTRP